MCVSQKVSWSLRVVRVECWVEERDWENYSFASRGYERMAGEWNGKSLSLVCYMNWAVRLIICMSVWCPPHTKSHMPRRKSHKMSIANALVCTIDVLRSIINKHTLQAGTKDSIYLLLSYSDFFDALVLFLIYALADETLLHFNIFCAFTAHAKNRLNTIRYGEPEDIHICAVVCTPNDLSQRHHFVGKEESEKKRRILEFVFHFILWLRLSWANIYFLSSSK